MKTRYLSTEPHEQRFEFHGEPVVHVFDEKSALAINAAIDAKRPLLVRGEPGTGKSQLALAAAHQLGRAFVSRVVDSETEARELFWTLDAVERLARAQVIGAIGATSEAAVRELLDESRFVSPGPLWWTFDWVDAEKQASEGGGARPLQPEGWSPELGVVLLIDEIDKADSSVPNGLLEALGNGQFPGPGKHGPVRRKGAAPLVVITTNEERALPDAFLRRCLVLQLSMPREEKELVAFLTARGKAHFPRMPPSVLEKAAVLLAGDRARLLERGLSPPGQAEYLDLLRAVAEHGKRKDEQEKLLDQIAEFALKKHPLGELE